MVPLKLVVIFLFLALSNGFKLDSVDEQGKYAQHESCEDGGVPHLTEWEDDPCPCFCGTGVTLSRRECVWKEFSARGDCVEVRTNEDSKPHPCGDAQLNKEKDCYNGTCLINMVWEKTADVYEAGSNSDFYYLAHTQAGQTCNIGKLDLADYNDRMRGKTDTYYLSMPCNACMKTATEVFDTIQVTIHGTDGWKADWIKVRVNGNNGTYYNPEWLDSNGSLIYANNYGHITQEDISE